MEFEFDPYKSASNMQKHGIDFVQAQALWADDHLLEVDVVVTPEARTLFIGKIGVKHWTAIATYRQEHIRLISVRRSRKKEVEIYEENQDN